MEISYQEYKPSQDLLSFIECFWLYTFEGGVNEVSPVQKCLPTGMYEILIHLDDNVSEILADGQWLKLPCDFFTGIYDNPVFLKMTGNVRLFGIRLKPEAFRRLFDAPAGTLFSNYRELSDFFGGQVKELQQAVKGKGRITDILARTEIALSKRIAVMEQQQDYITDAVHLMRHANGNITVGEISSSVSIGIRQLQRGFKDSMGTSPKTYLRLLRFRNTFTSLFEAGGWADISYDFGYADQAHFIREFRAFAGEAPNGVIKNAIHYHKKPLELTGSC